MSLVISSVFTYDTDAGNYIQAVETADGQALESATRKAINDFVIGCKQDGIWDAIKASCILSGARTLAGALTPLKGTAPTNNGPFVAGDYNRKTGLVGNGSTKYLDSNTLSSSYANTNTHLAAFLSSYAAASTRFIIGAKDNAATETGIQTGSTFAAVIHNRYINIQADAGRLFAAASTPAATNGRAKGTTVSTTAPVASMSGLNYFVLSQNNNGTAANYVQSSTRLAFYSIGESLDLAKLDGRVTDLINKFSQVIP